MHVLLLACDADTFAFYFIVCLPLRRKHCIQFLVGDLWTRCDVVHGYKR